MAASIVLAWHVDRLGALVGLQGLGYGATPMAESAVTLFFVLSGFLITLLLLREKGQTGSLAVGSFYERRILRIWPAYFLVLGLTFAALQWLPQQPHLRFPVSWYAFYLFLIPNVAYAANMGITPLLPLWSVGVEEQFYLLWPWIVGRSRSLMTSLLAILGGYLALKVALRVFENGWLYHLCRLTSFSSLTMGAILAWMVHTEHPILERLRSVPAQLAAWALAVTFVVYRPLQLTSLIDAEGQALVYAILILNVATNPRTLVRLEHPVLDYLGRISYGIYVYHLPVMFFVASIGGLVHSPLAALLEIYLITVLVAAVSYHFWEKPFLRRKRQGLGTGAAQA